MFSKSGTGSPAWLRLKHSLLAADHFIKTANLRTLGSVTKRGKCMREVPSFRVVPVDATVRPRGARFCGPLTKVQRVNQGHAEYLGPTWGRD
jgi:hypothetical protein